MTPSGSVKIWWDTSVAAYRMTSPYNAALVDALHKVIPYSDRQFDKSTKIWTFIEKYLAPLQTMFTAIGIAPTVVTRQQAEASQSQRGASSGNAMSQRGAPLTEVALQFLKLVGPDAAKRAYRAAAVELHPDKQGGNASRMSELNATWDRLQREVYSG